MAKTPYNQGFKQRISQEHYMKIGQNQMNNVESSGSLFDSSPTVELTPKMYQRNNIRRLHVYISSEQDSVTKTDRI